MRKKGTKTVTICSSVSFYKDVIEVKKKLENAGWTVLVPQLALEMEKANNFEFDAYKERFNGNDPKVKVGLIMAHFKRIEQADAVLIINKQKNGVEGYIGPNVLMEMGVSLYFQKPIYLWVNVTSENRGYEEIMAMQPTVINQDINKII